MTNNMKIIVLLLGLAMGFIAAIYVLPSFQEQQMPMTRAGLMPAEQTLIRGTARAISSARPPGESFTFKDADKPHEAFKAVPAGKRFILKDINYYPQASVRAPLTVNIADKDPETYTHAILFQVHVNPRQSRDIHFSSGYVLPAGHELTAFTAGALAEEQYVSLGVAGYLVAE